MESHLAGTIPAPRFARALPRWVLQASRAPGEADAAFAAGAALALLDEIASLEFAWAGCWRDRLALSCAVQAVRHAGRDESEAELRDTLLLTAPGDDPGPAGQIRLAYRGLTRPVFRISTQALRELAARLALRWDDRLAGVVDLLDSAVHKDIAPPFAAADLVAEIIDNRADAEILAWWMADWLLASRMGWERPVPLMMAQRNSAAFRTSGGRGRLRPGDPGFRRATCLAIVQAASEAIGLANDIDRRAGMLLKVAPKLRTKGAEAVIRRLLDEDAVSVSSPGADLSRWASRRLFERLTGLGAVREFSGRTMFRIHGL